jgi:hypothetical protein
MSLAAIVTLMLLEPPIDDRSEVLHAVHVLTEGAAKGDYAAFSAMLEPGGATVMVDMRESEPQVTVLTNRQVLEANRNAKPVEGRQSQFGEPTVLIRERIAQVWVPYQTSISGKLSHCGIDNFSLVKRHGQWMVTNMSYTVEPAGKCGERDAGIRTNDPFAP